jgi:hypothetical protein
MEPHPKAFKLCGRCRGVVYCRVAPRISRRTGAATNAVTAARPLHHPLGRLRRWRWRRWRLPRSRWRRRRLMRRRRRMCLR